MNWLFQGFGENKFSKYAVADVYIYVVDNLSKFIHLAVTFDNYVASLVSQGIYIAAAV